MTKTSIYTARWLLRPLPITDYCDYHTNKAFPLIKCIGLLDDIIVTFIIIIMWFDINRSTVDEVMRE